MKRLWFSLAAGLCVAATVWHVRDHRAAAPTGAPATATGDSPARAAAPPRRDVPVAHVPAAQTDVALDSVVGGAQSYWELSPEARAEYDRLEAQRLARLGVDDVTRRLAPHREVLTLDGKEVTP
jgi:hypothetical protein